MTKVGIVVVDAVVLPDEFGCARTQRRSAVERNLTEEESVDIVLVVIIITTDNAPSPILVSVVILQPIVIIVEIVGIGRQVV